MPDHPRENGMQQSRFRARRGGPRALLASVALTVSIGAAWGLGCTARQAAHDSDSPAIAARPRVALDPQVAPLLTPSAEPAAAVPESPASAAVVPPNSAIIFNEVPAADAEPPPPDYGTSFADLAEDNPNIRQQYEQWRAEREAKGQGLGDWDEFRQLMRAIGAPDPGPRPPDDFS
jgi:hypothetical protein